MCVCVCVCVGCGVWGVGCGGEWRNDLARLLAGFWLDAWRWPGHQVPRTGIGKNIICNLSKDGCVAGSQQKAGDNFQQKAWVAEECRDGRVLSIFKRMHWARASRGGESSVRRSAGRWGMKVRSS